MPKPFCLSDVRPLVTCSCTQAYHKAKCLMPRTEGNSDMQLQYAMRNFATNRRGFGFSYKILLSLKWRSQCSKDQYCMVNLYH
jgi:hypothetical protein